MIEALCAAVSAKVADADYSIIKSINYSGSVSGDYYGCAVVASGDGGVVVVGAKWAKGPAGSRGAAYVFTRDAAGDYVNRQVLVPTGVITGDEDYGFELGLSTDGSTLIVGAPNTTLARENSSGVAYIYKFNTQTLTFDQIQRFNNPSGRYGEYYGCSARADRDGGTIVVGARRGQGANQTACGYVHVLKRKPDGTYEVVQTLYNYSIYADNEFGISVDISSDASTIVVGGAGSGYRQSTLTIFELQPSGQYSIVKYYTSGTTAQYGASVSVSADGSKLVCGSYGSTAGRPGGTAYIYTRTGLGQYMQYEFTGITLRQGDRFGTAVSVSDDGNYALVTAPYRDAIASNTSDDNGIAVIYSIAKNGEPTVAETLTHPNERYYGSSGLILDKGIAIVGSFGRNKATRYG